jgi:hypothetical protein
MEELQRALGRLEGKLDAILDNFKMSNKRFESIEERLLDVEKKVWYAAGLSGALSVVLSMLARRFL